MYRFDDILNLILNGISDDDEQKKLDDYICDENTGYSQKVILYIICIEKKMCETAMCIFPDMETYYYGAFDISALLYSDEKRGIARQHIRNECRYQLSLNFKYNIDILYHLMKNKCRDIISEILDIILLFKKASEDESISQLMGIAAKNKDIETLRLFLDKGMRMNIYDIEYVKKIDEGYFFEAVLPELEKYNEEGAECLT